MTHDTTDGDDGRLRRFERNRYFHGKLMTARDMQREQEYHRNRLDAVTQHVTGAGIVCGLETTATEEDGSLEVTVQPGLALDDHGCPVVVEDRATEEIDLSTVTDEVSLYLEYDTCVTETVPVPGSEDACKEECTYNRVLEIFEITHEPGPPAEQKPVRHVAFPSSTDFDLSEGKTQPDPNHDELHRTARSYYEDDGALRECGSGDGGSIFLGHFTTSGDSSWTRVTDGEPRPHVFTNDMLYAAITRHAADFGNPHEVALSVGEPDAGAIVRVTDSATPEGNVELGSPDDTLTITADADAKRIGLDVAKRLLDRVDELEVRLDRHDRYALERALWCTCRSFASVEQQFTLDVAGEIADQAKMAVEKEVYDDLDAYLEFLTGTEDRPGVLELERHVGERLTKQGGVTGLERYKTAVSRLKEAVNEETDALEIARAQDRVCNAAACFEGETPEEEPDTDLEASLQAKTEAYAQIRDQFDVEAAEEIVRQVKTALTDGVHEADDQYREFLRSIVELETTVLSEVKDQITTESGRRYAMALSELQTALEEEASVQELAAAQNKLSDAARRLESGEGVSTELSTGIAVNPQERTVEKLREEVTSVTNREELEKMLLAEMVGDDRITAEKAISKQLDSVIR